MGCPVLRIMVGYIVTMVVLSAGLGVVTQWMLAAKLITNG